MNQPIQHNGPSARTEELPDWTGTLFVMISTIILAYSTLLTSLSIVVFYLLWLPVAFLRFKAYFRLSRVSWMIFLLPALATYSFFWSDYPSRTLYYGLQFLTVVMCALVVGNGVRARAILAGLSLGCSAVLVATILKGYYHIDNLTGERYLVGFFNSKNQVGLYASVCLLSSTAALLTEKNIWRRALFALLPAGIAITSLYLSKSVSALFAYGFAFSFILASWMSRFFNFPQRLLILLFLSFSAIPVAVSLYVFQFNPMTSLLDSTGKDSTLTGRTYLWSEGIKIAERKPILGHGYSAFWVRGRPEAEYFWYTFEVPDRNGFHFHNIYIQSYVDLGALGVLASIIMISATFLYSILGVIRLGWSPVTAYAMGFSAMFLVRSFVEVDFFGQYNVGTLILFSVLPLLSRQYLQRT